MSLDKPALSIELGLTAGFNDAVGTVAWTDITPYVVTWGTNRGRNPQKPPAHFDPGVASLVLNNRDRRFDPTNTAGPYWPNLKPARVRLRIRANYPGILTPNLAMVDEVSKWAVYVNCTLSRPILGDGEAALRMTSVAAGAMEAFSPIGTAGRPVTEGTTYTAVASFLAGVGTPAASITILWYAADGSPISGSTGATVVANTVTETQAFVTAAAPAGAAFAALFPAVVAAGASESHYVRKFGLGPGSSTAWARPKDVITCYVKRWPPEWTASSTSVAKITAVDALGAPLNLAQVAATVWSTMVANDKPKVWWRLGESSGTVAADATAHRLDGQYQGSPALGQDGLVNYDSDKGAAFPSGSRMSAPYKNLITGYPFTFECWFSAAMDRSRQRAFLTAYDTPSADGRQFVELFIDYSGNPTTAGKIVFFLDNPAPTRTTAWSSITVDDLFRHHLAVVMASASSVKIYIDGVDRTVAGTVGTPAFPDDLVTGYAIGNTPAVAFGDFNFSTTPGVDVIDEVAIYDYALSPTRILQHYQGGGWPVGVGETSGGHVQRILTEAKWPGPSSIDAGASSLQMLTAAGSVTANVQKIEEAEQGALFIAGDGTLVFQGRHAVLHAPYDTSQATFGQGVGDLPYEAPVTWGNEDSELYNRATGSRAGGAEFTVDDVASQGEYGMRPLAAADGLWNLADAEVVDLLTYRVGKYSQPVPTVRQIRVHPAAVPATLYPVVLGLELRARITVKVAPPGGGPTFSQESHIERIAHEVDDKGDWWVVFDVSAADTTPYVILDDPARGLLDSGNRVAF